MYSVFKIIRIRVCGFEDSNTLGHMVLLGEHHEHINLQCEKEKELLGLIKKFVKSKKAVGYFALMLILQ